MSKYRRETIDVSGLDDLNVYKEIIAFMAANGYHFEQCVEPVSIEGKKEIDGRLLSKLAVLKVGLWHRGYDLTIVFNYTEAATEDADIIKRILLHRSSRSGPYFRSDRNERDYRERYYRFPLSTEMRRESTEEINRNNSFAEESDADIMRCYECTNFERKNERTGYCRYFNMEINNNHRICEAMKDTFY